MCGIAGCMVLDKRGVSQQKRERIARTLLLDNQVRGTDATGLATYENGGVRILKGVMKAEEFIESAEFEELKWGHSFILHTRAATNGAKEDNKNNHPFAGKTTTLIHNGVVSMDDIEGYEYDGECDSERILGEIETHGMIEGLENIHGSACVATMNNATGGIKLIRWKNPLYMGIIPDEYIIFSSRKQGIEKVFEYERSNYGFFPAGIIREVEENELVDIPMRKSTIHTTKTNIITHYNTTVVKYGNRKKREYVTELLAGGVIAPKHSDFCYLPGYGWGYLRAWEASRRYGCRPYNFPAHTITNSHWGDRLSLYDEKEDEWSVKFPGGGFVVLEGEKYCPESAEKFARYLLRTYSSAEDAEKRVDYETLKRMGFPKKRLGGY